jgi:hypothetical protein
MRSKLETYTFSKQEIKILRAIVSGSHLLSSLRKSLSIKPSLLSYYVGRLVNKNLIKCQKQGFPLEQREKSGKYLYFSDSKHALSLKELLSKYSHIEWEEILSGLGIEVLFQILANYHITFESFSAVTFWRYSKSFMGLGLVESDGDIFRINSKFSMLIDFLTDYQHFIISNIVRSLPQNVIILWQKDLECLIRLPKDMRIDWKEFQKTATSCLQDFGIQLTSDFDVYFYSRRKKAIRLEDVLLHTLLIERNNVRYTTYSLLLLKKQSKRIDKEYLFKEAVWFDLSGQINTMFEFLRTKGARSGSAFPTWTEFTIKAEDYGVSL